MGITRPRPDGGVNMCVTREWNVAKKGQTTCILTNFEKPSRRSQSFAQRNFCSNPENIFS